MNCTGGPPDSRSNQGRWQLTFRRRRRRRRPQAGAMAFPAPLGDVGRCRGNGVQPQARLDGASYGTHRKPLFPPAHSERTGYTAPEVEVLEQNLSELVFSQMDRGQIRDWVQQLTGDSCRLRKPGAADLFAEVIHALPPEERHALWPRILRDLEDWRAATEQFGLPESKTALRDHVLGELRKRRKTKRTAARRTRARAAVAELTLDIDFDLETELGVDLVLGPDHVDNMVEMIDLAVEEIVLVAYVLGGGFKSVAQALQRADTRGVPIHMFLDDRYPSKKSKKRRNDGRISQFEFDHEVSGGQIHAKFLVVDRKHILIGSSNVDSPSNPAFQANLRLTDAGLARQLVAALAEIQPSA